MKKQKKKDKVKRLVLIVISTCWLISIYQLLRLPKDIDNIDDGANYLLPIVDHHRDRHRHNDRQKHQRSSGGGEFAASTIDDVSSEQEKQQQLVLLKSSSTATKDKNEEKKKVEESLLLQQQQIQLPAPKEEYTVKGQWGEYIVVDPTRVKRSIMQRYYNESSSASSASLDSYLLFHSTNERQQVCSNSTEFWSTTGNHLPSTTIDDSMYNKIQVGGPNQGFYHITRTQTTDSKLRQHLLMQNVSSSVPPQKTNIQQQQQHDPSSNSNSNSNSTNNQKQKQKQPRILCAIYTHDDEGRREMITAIVETWGWKCDGFFAASTHNRLTERSNNSGYGSIQLPHKGLESYNNMWQKTRSILQYMYTHYLDDGYDFFYLCGDDVHVIIENLRNTLTSIGDDDRAYNQPLFMGNWIPLSKKQKVKSSIKLATYKGYSDYFICGGPGYVLNKLTLIKLVEEILPICHVNVKSSIEDILISDCLKRYAIFGNNTVDSDGGQRFDSSPRHYTRFTNDLASRRDIPDYWLNAIKFWTYHFSSTFGDQNNDSIQKYHLNHRISSQTIALHGFKSPLELKQHHARLYNSCD